MNIKKRKTKKDIKQEQEQKYILEKIETMKNDFIDNGNIISIDEKNYSYKDFIDLILADLKEEK
jgi:hypothetical protein